MTTRGFTLIEVLLYIAIFGLLMAGTMRVAYALSSSEARDTARAMLQTEGDFILEKFSYAASHASAVSLPIAGKSGTQLSLTMATGLDAQGNATTTSMVIEPDSQNSNQIDIQVGSAALEALNSSHTTVSLLNFYYSTTTLGASRGSLGMSFMLEERTQDGASVSEEFMSTTSLQQ
jgi:prepilin-type N-terminal cleavage/methylation domain-containing protein